MLAASRGGRSSAQRPAVLTPPRAASAQGWKLVATGGAILVTRCGSRCSLRSRDGRAAGDGSKYHNRGWPARSSSKSRSDSIRSMQASASRKSSAAVRLSALGERVRSRLARSEKSATPHDAESDEINPAPTTLPPHRPSPEAENQSTESLHQTQSGSTPRALAGVDMALGQLGEARRWLTAAESAASACGAVTEQVQVWIRSAEVDRAVGGADSMLRASRACLRAMRGADTIGAQSLSNRAARVLNSEGPVALGAADLPERDPIHGRGGLDAVVEEVGASTGVPGRAGHQQSGRHPDADQAWRSSGPVPSPRRSGRAARMIAAVEPRDRRRCPGQRGCC